MNRQQLPSDDDAEKSVIGGLLFSGRAFSQVADVLVAADFYDAKLEAIYSAMVLLDGQTPPRAIDLITVADEMRRANTMGRLAAVGNEGYLAELANGVGTVENIGQHAAIVRDKANRRRLALAGDSILQLATSEDLDYLNRAQQLVFDVQQRGAQQSYRPIGPIVLEALRNLNDRFERRQEVTGVPTTYTQFDDMTAGLQAGDLVIVAGRPSMGKTTWALNVAKAAAELHKVPSLVFSMEMKDRSLVERILCSEARIPSQRFRTGRLEDLDWQNVYKASSRIAELPIAIDDSGALGLQEVRAKGRRWRTDPRFFKPSADGAEQLGLVVVDYLQLMHGSGRGGEQNRNQEISEITRGLKQLARELNVPVVALSQLNRSLESRADRRPLMSDLRESGAIEQDADVIVFLYRDEVYNKESPDKGTAELIIGKQRNGPTGMVRLAFLGEFTTFENLAEDWR